MKSKCVFLFKCFAVMIPLWGTIIYARFNMLKYMDGEAPNYIWNKEVCTSTQEKYYDVVILGDSTANAAYMPELLSDTTINLALGGVTPMENYYVMKEYLQNNEAPKSVYISFYDNHLQMSNCFWERSIYSHRFTAHDSWEMLQKAKYYNDTSVVIEDAELNWLAYQLYLPNKYITALCNASINQRYEDNLVYQNMYKIHRGRYIARGVSEWTKDGLYHDSFYVVPLLDDYYKQLIELCLSNDIKVHLIKLPPLSINTFSDEYVNGCKEYYDSLQNQYPEITLDWFDEYDSWCFYDPFHLNDHGALRFTLELKKKYPEEFCNVYTNDQLSGISDSIKNENLFSELVTWVSECKDYSLLIYDGVGDFETRYSADFAEDNLLISKEASESELTEFYLIGEEKQSDLYAVHVDEEAVSIVFENGDVYTWSPYDTSEISVVVIDNLNNQVVCEKEYKYEEVSEYSLQK